MTEAIEIWKPIDPSGLYLVSDLGRIKGTKTNTILAQKLSRKGYLFSAGWIGKPSKYVRFNVARCVAKAFIPNPLNKPQVNHLSGVKIDNRPSNLEWATALENIQHAVNVLGQHHIGESNSMAMIGPESVGLIRQLARLRSIKEIAELFRICRMSAYDCARGKTWSHLNSIHPPYTFPMRGVTRKLDRLFP